MPPPPPLSPLRTLHLLLRPHLPTFSLPSLRPPILPLPQRQPPTTVTPTHTRSAHHASQGRANGVATSRPGKRLGLKRPASSLVVPGCIIFRQRGTHWFPGENCGMGRDHTIYAKEKGYVVFYSTPWRGTKAKDAGRRRFIGVTFERGVGLPRSGERGRERRLGLCGRGREELDVEGGSEGGEVEVGGLTEAQGTMRQQPASQRAKLPQQISRGIKPGYQYRDSNMQIGRVAEGAKVKVRTYKRGDRFLAWRKRNAKKVLRAEKSMGSRKRKGEAKKAPRGGR